MELGGFGMDLDRTQEGLQALLKWWRKDSEGRPKMIIATLVLPQQKHYVKVLTEAGFINLTGSEAAYSDSRMELYVIICPRTKRNLDSSNALPEVEILGEYNEIVKNFQARVLDILKATHSNNHWGHYEPMKISA
jgi:hypothetical protein